MNRRLRYGDLWIFTPWTPINVFFKILIPVQKTEINDRGNLLRWPLNTLYLQKLAPTSPTSGGRLFGIVRSRTKATEFSFSLVFRAILINVNINILGQG
jgi:hypothetical protein